jgi:type I protein arginine methyltransferase
MRIDYHRTLLSDGVRNAAFHAALKALIVPGVTTVADIGAGTGLLGLMASKLGAKHVYLYETAEVVGVAARILKANRARNCELIGGHSTDMLDPPQVDLVVSETLGTYAFEENIIATLNDARARFLKPGGVMIPSGVTQCVAPVIAPRIHQELTAWDTVGFGLDFSIGKTMSLNNAYVRVISPAELLDSGRSAVAWDRVNFSTSAKAARPKSNRSGEANWRVAAPLTVYGFATWWTCDLAPGVSLSTAPDAPRTHWEQLYFPLLDPIALKAGESVSVSLRSRSSEAGGTHLAWTATHQDAKGRQLTRQALDLDKGYLP